MCLCDVCLVAVPCRRARRVSSRFQGRLSGTLCRRSRSSSTLSQRPRPRVRFGHVLDGQVRARRAEGQGGAVRGRVAFKTVETAVKLPRKYP